MPAPTPTRILACLDHEGVARPAAHQAVLLARAFGAELEVCHVVAQGRGALHLVRPLEPDHAQRVAEQVFQVHGIDAPGSTFHVRQGNPVREITALAAQIQADLVVLGPHSRRASDFLLGQTALRLVQLSGAPTLVYRGSVSRLYERLLVGVDLSEESRAALTVAIHWAQALGAALHVVHVFEPPDFAYRKGDAQLDNYVMADVRRDEHAELKSLLDASGFGGLVPTVHELEGDAYEGIADVARRVDADLVLCGSHGRTGLRGLLLGSVSERLLRGADGRGRSNGSGDGSRSVLIVRG
jgi:nucleotide-binding universal stress UspA family protein